MESVANVVVVVVAIVVLDGLGEIAGGGGR